MNMLSGFMTSNPSGAAVLAWARLMKVQRIALARAEDALKAARLPSLAWYDALLELERVGETGMRPFELEAEMLLAQHNLSRLIDRLQSSGYVERRDCPDDKRGQLLFITPAGRTIRRRMWPVYAKVIEAVIGARLPEKDVKKLAENLGVLAK
jgi:DNA-binding MarR family transcriptional regulator